MVDSCASQDVARISCWRSSPPNPCFEQAEVWIVELESEGLPLIRGRKVAAPDLPRRHHITDENRRPALKINC